MLGTHTGFSARICDLAPLKRPNKTDSDRLYLQGQWVDYNRQKCMLCCVEYSKPYCWKVDMQSHVLKNDIYCSALCIIFFFIISARFRLSSLIFFPCFHAICVFICAKWVIQWFWHWLSLNMAILIIWLPCATVTGKPSKQHSRASCSFAFPLVVLSHNV